MDYVCMLVCVCVRVCVCVYVCVCMFMFMYVYVSLEVARQQACVKMFLSEGIHKYEDLCVYIQQNSYSTQAVL